MLERAIASRETAARAQDYAAEALQWLIDDGVAASVTVAAAWMADGGLRLSVSIVRNDANGAAANPKFDLVWKRTLAG